MASSPDLNSSQGRVLVSMPPDVLSILEEEEVDTPYPCFQVPREDNRTVERAEEESGEYGGRSKALCRSISLIIVQGGWTIISEVLDPTNDIRINDPHPVDCGGFADIYRGE